MITPTILILLNKDLYYYMRNPTYIDYRCNVYISSYNMTNKMNIRSQVSVTNEAMTESRLEVDSYANMPGVGKYAHILSSTGQTAGVNDYSPQYEPMQIHIVDNAVQFTCPYSGKIYTLITRNALHVPTITNHIILPFITREVTMHLKSMWMILIQ